MYVRLSRAYFGPERCQEIRRLLIEGIWRRKSASSPAW